MCCSLAAVINEISQRKVQDRNCINNSNHTRDECAMILEELFYTEILLENYLVQKHAMYRINCSQNIRCIVRTVNAILRSVIL